MPTRNHSAGRAHSTDFIYMDEFAPQLHQIASMRSELRALQSAIEAQQSRISASNRVRRESLELRNELHSLSSSMDSRRHALQRLQSRQLDVDALAEQVASIASSATESIQAERAIAQRRQPPQPLPPPNREQMLAEARERIERRGMSGTGVLGPRALAIAAGRESMFDRIRALQGAAEERARMAAADLEGDPVVDELKLLRTIKDVCSICLEQRRKGELCWVLGCGHCFHEHCASRWLGGNSSCPLCKSVVARKKR